MSATSSATSSSARSLTPINNTGRRPRELAGHNLLDFLKRGQLVRRGLASKKTRRRRTRNELLHTLEHSVMVKVLLIGLFAGGLAFLVFSGQQPELTKNFVIALLFLATALVQLWINQPKTF